MVQSLWSILAVRQRLPRYQMVANGSVACPHHRSVMFLINNATGRLPSDRINELAGNGTLTVINAGAHYSKAKGSSGLSDFTNDLRTAASALAAMPSRGLVVWRSMHVPHPMCEEEDNPWPPEHAAMRMEHLHARCMSKARPPSSCPANATSDKGYSWDIYPEFDKVARALLTPLGVRFLDITQLSRSRPDAHSMPSPPTVPLVPPPPLTPPLQYSPPSRPPSTPPWPSAPSPQPSTPLSTPNSPPPH